MAKVTKTSLYACITTCTADVVSDKGEAYQRRFFAISDLETDKLVEGGVDESRCMYQVPKGEIVCMHFIPVDDNAKEDREDQMTNPGKYIKTERDIILIGELLCKDGQFRSTKAAVAAIKDMENVDDSLIVPAGADVQRELAILELMSRADDDKARRKMFLDILAAGDVKMFRGADPSAMAGRIYDEELYKKA